MCKKNSKYLFLVLILFVSGLMFADSAIQKADSTIQKIDFKKFDEKDWIKAREGRFSGFGSFVPPKGGIVNFIPENTTVRLTDLRFHVTTIITISYGCK